MPGENGRLLKMHLAYKESNFLLQNLQMSNRAGLKLPASRRSLRSHARINVSMSVAKVRMPVHLLLHWLLICCHHQHRLHV